MKQVVNALYVALLVVKWYTLKYMNTDDLTIEEYGKLAAKNLIDKSKWWGLAPRFKKPTFFERLFRKFRKEKGYTLIPWVMDEESKAKRDQILNDYNKLLKVQEEITDAEFEYFKFLNEAIKNYDIPKDFKKERIIKIK